MLVGRLFLRSRKKAQEKKLPYHEGGAGEEHYLGESVSAITYERQNFEGN